MRSPIFVMPEQGSKTEGREVESEELDINIEEAKGYQERIGGSE